MKKLPFLFSLCLLLPYGAQADTHLFPGGKRPPAMLWQEQIVAYISYPEVLLQANREGIVALSYQVNADNRVSQVQVHASDERLKADLIKQLTGKKLYGSQPDQQKTHTIRLRFRLVD